MEGITRRFVLGGLAALPASRFTTARAQPMPVTAVDIALEPDATMIQRAMADNGRLLKEFPKGFALDATHHPHVTLLQQFVRTADLDKFYAAANAVLAKEKPASWKLKAYKYYYIPSPPVGLAGIVVEPTAELHRLQQEIIEAVTPFTEKIGTPAAFMSTEEGRLSSRSYSNTSGTSCTSPQARNSIRTSLLVSAPRSTLTRCLPNRSRPSRSPLWERRSTSLVALGRHGRS